MGLLSRWSGGLVDRYGAGTPLTVGPVIAGAGFALLALPDIGGSYWATFCPGLAVLGLGMSISVGPLTTTVMSAVPDRYAGAASGINNAVARLAGLLAVALLGTLAVGVLREALERRLAALRVPPEVHQAVLRQAPQLAEARIIPQVGATLRGILERALAESFVSSFRVVMLVTAALALLSAVCAAFSIAPVRSRK